MEKSAEKILTDLNSFDTSSVLSNEQRMSHLPAKNVTWSGERGNSMCYFHELGVSIDYDRGNPDFSEYSVASVKIGDMTETRYSVSEEGNFFQADNELLKTSFAVENGLYTRKDVERFRKIYGLTWHEDMDGVSMILIDTRIHQVATHPGGVKASKEYNIEYGNNQIENTRKFIAKRRQDIRKANVRTYNTTKSTLEDIDDILFDSTMQQIEKIDAKSLALSPVVQSSTRHIANVINGKQNLSDATIDIAFETASAEITKYAEQQVTEIGIKVANGTVKSIEKVALEKASGEAAVKLLKSIDTNVLVKASAAIGKALIQFLECEGSILALVDSMVKSGIDIVNTCIGGFVGTEIGADIGAFIGFFCGNAFVGALVGAAIGDFVGCIIGSQAREAFERWVGESKMAEADRYLQSQRMLAREIDIQTKCLMENLALLHMEHEKVIQDSFNEMIRGISIGDFDVIDKGTQMLCSEFGFEVAFENQDDFDAFMLDDTQSVHIGRVRRK